MGEKGQLQLGSSTFLFLVTDPWKKLTTLNTSLPKHTKTDWGEDPLSDMLSLKCLHTGEALERDPSLTRKSTSLLYTLCAHTPRVICILFSVCQGFAPHLSQKIRYGIFHLWLYLSAQKVCVSEHCRFQAFRFRMLSTCLQIIPSESPLKALNNNLKHFSTRHGSNLKLYFL